MPAEAVDVTGIGNAIVDAVARVDDAFLAANGVDKGAMTLVDAARAAALHARMGPAAEVSGGSAANTAVGLARLGARAAFVGKVRDDAAGAAFRRDIAAAGVRFDTPSAAGGPGTARCLVLVTPDAQRSMNTYLGACLELGPEDVDEDAIRASGAVYLEGYLWDPPRARAAFLKAAGIARAAGGKVALSLSDPFCVERHRDSFRDLVENRVDILFANEAEIVALHRAADFDAAVRATRGLCEIAALTRSEKGSVVLAGGEAHVLTAEPAARVADTTGAGDLYAAGFLYGRARGYGPALCGRLGGVAAAEIVSHYGARPEADLAVLAAAAIGE